MIQAENGLLHCPASGRLIARVEPEDREQLPEGPPMWKDREPTSWSLPRHQRVAAFAAYYGEGEKGQQGRSSRCSMGGPDAVMRLSSALKLLFLPTKPGSKACPARSSRYRPSWTSLAVGDRAPTSRSNMNAVSPSGQPP